MSAKQVRGVMFDLGGTLCDYSMEMGAATVAGLSRLGFDPTDDKVMEAIINAAVEASQDYATRTTYLHRDLFRDQFARTAALLGAEADAELLDWFEAENLTTIIEHLRPRPDAAELLSALRDRKIYCSVVSNADDDFLGPTLARHGLDVFLNDWTSSQEAGSCKPDPKIYRHALEKSGLSVDEVLFVGDSVQHDIAGAVVVGMRSALISNGLGTAPFSHGMHAEVVPDFTVQELRELIGIIDDLNDKR
jgi:2-haloalkanoic acid dehalogenase type II